MQIISFEQMTGRCQAHLVELTPAAGEGSVYLTRAAASAFRQLAREAAQAGIGLAVASAYRSFDRQLAIWNAKAAGQRAVLDAEGQPLVMEDLSERERVFAILRWSALPGASRHHWGTDVDVYDAAGMPPGYRLRLTPGEAAPGGVFHALHRWLDEHLDGAGCGAFCRPYCRDLGGVAPEPWHLSYAPQASEIERGFEAGALRAFITGQPLALKQAVLDNFDEIFARFVLPQGGAVRQARG